MVELFLPGYGKVRWKTIVVEWEGRKDVIRMPLSDDRIYDAEIEAWIRERSLKALKEKKIKVSKYNKTEIAQALKEFDEWRHKKGKML